MNIQEKYIDMQYRLENGKATTNEIRKECGLPEIDSKNANIKFVKLSLEDKTNV